MDYSKYFQPQQKVLVRSRGIKSGRFSEDFSAHLDVCSEDYFDLSLPYDLVESHALLFPPETVFTIISSALGMGVQVDARLLKQLDASHLRLLPSGSLELFGQRRFLRAEMPLRFSAVRQDTDYTTFRSKWSDMVRALQAGSAPPPAPLPAPRSASLGAGGMGISLPSPVADGEIMMIQMEFEDGQPAICVLGEVVWSKEGGEVGMQEIGVRFNDITPDDQERIDRFVTERLQQTGHDVEWYLARGQLLDKLLF